MSERCQILGMPVNVTNKNMAVRGICELAQQKKGAYVCVSNVHMCIEAFDSSEFANVVSNADYILPDGKPLSWAQKLLGHKNAEQVRGQDIVNSLCNLSASQDLKIGLYGGTSNEVLAKVINALENKYRGINITYSFSPPFRPLTNIENHTVEQEINKSEVDILFVGIGCPKQERWMAAHKDNLTCVMLGVGAAFDFISGEKKHAPRFMQKIGMEWLFRLASEPRRLFKRYFTTNPRFVYLFALQLIRQNK
jgi:N-acetylglucosaminyldiphosphoundecaprenol N-acetyl-beta-D-mannosaminyltransferase